MESTTNNNSIKNKDIDDHFIINILQKFIYTHKPLFKESLNDLYNATTYTYIIEMNNSIIPRIIKVLNMINYRNESYLSYDEKDIHGLTYKSYAFYKEQKIENGYKKFVFCLEDDKGCKGILLSPTFK